MKRALVAIFIMLCALGTSAWALGKSEAVINPPDNFQVTAIVECQPVSTPTHVTLCSVPVALYAFPAEAKAGAALAARVGFWAPSATDADTGTFYAPAAIKYLTIRRRCLGC